MKISAPNGWIGFTQSPDSDRDVLVTDGREVDIGYFQAKEGRFLCTTIKSVRYWMDIPELPVTVNMLHEDSYDLYKNCRELVLDFKTANIDSIGRAFIDNAELALKSYDNRGDDFFKRWLAEKSLRMMETTTASNIATGRGY